MLFSGITFLYYFLPWTVVLYFLVPSKMKNLVLFVSSLIFYAWGEPRIVFLMLFTVLVCYVLGLLTEKNPGNRKLYLALALAFGLGSLGYFKYADFFIGSMNAITGLSVPMLKIALPVGISFYTFQVLSYNIDLYRGEVKAQQNFLHLATYIAMFPQLVAGPIVRYKDVAVQLEKRTHSVDKFAYGSRRFVYGLAKKVLLANAFGEVCSVFGQSHEKSILFCWMYAAGFSLQIYFDFSGYSDMAIGLGKIFGFDFMENFDYPYISKSITEFWRRWHISLGTWFRDYVYIPMGGSRVKRGKLFFNLLVVWMLTGLWHGAAWNFVIWGLYFAVFLIIEKIFLLKYLERSKIWSHVYVILIVMISFVIFDAPDMGQAMRQIRDMFGLGGLPLVSVEAVYYLKSYGLLFVFAVLGATPLPKKAAEKAVTRIKCAGCAEPVIVIALLVLITAYLVDGSFNPFLYFRF